jgi:hypothetical protein
MKYNTRRPGSVEPRAKMKVMGSQGPVRSSSPATAAVSLAERLISKETGHTLPHVNGHRTGYSHGREDEECKLHFERTGAILICG